MARRHGGLSPVIQVRVIFGELWTSRADTGGVVLIIGKTNFWLHLTTQSFNRFFRFPHGASPCVTHAQAWQCLPRFVASNGREWSGMEENGAEWKRMEWNGREWNGMEENGMEEI
jgi:hypothetical protein